MTTPGKCVTRLADYRPFGWHLRAVELRFSLDPRATKVASRLSFEPRRDVEQSVFALDGEELKTLRLAIDGCEIEGSFERGRLILDVPSTPFVFEAEVEIGPASNRALEGLYMSSGLYCTQCEAEGFRRITWYPDRPDVLAPFTVLIEAPHPVLLSNGNLVERGEGFAIWHDPWPKPSYLFALVAGDLSARKARFVTFEGRDVELAVWTRAADRERSAYAMDALIRAMKWDEEVYGRAYDLDVFNLVSVDDFAAGAMENKGLNIFNSAYTLASPQTATDHDYAMIEGVVAHEYFHNWTGNRVTCRDWFQLCLKEGLTVFRDQQFSGDMRSSAVKRIEDALTLRAAQFPEDAGPLAHAVRPQEYVEIDNFYTATVYEKGAEVVGMLRTLVGVEHFRKGCDLYFARHDGQAATVEDWLACIAEISGRDLTQFSLWYSQAGTPRVAVKEAFEDGKFHLTLAQELPPTPGQPEKSPMVIPVAVGLLDRNGREIVPTTVLELTEAQQTFTFDGLADRPLASLLRGFSAPVRLDHARDEAEQLFLLRHDTDPFARWEIGRRLAKAALLDALENKEASSDWLAGLEAILIDEGLDPAYRALCLHLPSEDDVAQSLAEAGACPDPAQIRRSRDRLRATIGRRLAVPLAQAFEANDKGDEIDPTAAGHRQLRLTALGLLSVAEGPSRARALFADTGNMTESIASLGLLVEDGTADDELATFENRWRDDPGATDKWFAVQVSQAQPDAALAAARRLARHPRFTWKRPNRFRALVGAFGRNTAAVHHASGEGYRFVADWIISMDGKVSQVAARTATLFETISRYDRDRRDLMAAQMRRIREKPGLSSDTAEILDRILGG